jgi:multidrug efflux system membrane fusion protein
MDALTRDTPAVHRPSRTRRAVMALLCLAVAAAIGWAIWLWPKHAALDPRAARADVVPVVAGIARIADVPIYRLGLGTVQAYNTVNVHVMVDGPLTEVRFHEGQDVKRGDLLARVDPRTYQAALDLALAKRAQDEAQLANARVDLSRYQKLVANQYTSAQTADTQKATVAQLEAQLRQDQAQIDTARTNLSYTDITAPIDGRAGLRTVDAGNIVHGSDSTSLTVISQLRPIYVVFTLPQQDLPAVTEAMAAGPVPAEARRQSDAGTDDEVLDRGTLSVLDNSVDPATGTIKLKATFPNAALTLWPGAFVTVRVLVATQSHALVVPPGAVQRGPHGAFLYVLNADNTVSRRDITLGHEDTQYAVVTAGLAEGTRVVEEGAARLSDGAHVTLPAAH